jgi:hypothetical protein
LATENAKVKYISKRWNVADPALTWEVRLCDLMAEVNAAIAAYLATDSRNRDAMKLAEGRSKDAIKALKFHLAARSF